MSPDTARQFDTEFAPRIARAIADLLGHRASAEVVGYGGHGHPTQVRIAAPPAEHVRGYAHPLDIALTWDTDEIERLMAADGPARFERYLAALGRKLPAWENARGIDFGSRTQADAFVLIGGLDFEA
ncbi:DUF5594 family protein [Burkholderia oklahomensis]|uniref:DUF5594 domain-containing protein n=1 Tax=Burkholderia oklahomensis TaxID=342113 RepID=A0AAI8B3X1_9BURK|nr:DUF5594 family protein [Burkholderia oklahomensis]AIO65093.1 hypothetical protein DM82_480 [Burkholderia oklahomensis]AJX31419.1 hypothetical protein BG90_542 [Burkholderia oklahomensis C6786]AOI43145.1 hypothetical protein WG70_26905 [Burkholderia oklahomensis EO147]AOI46707.1 hypothetical protein WI23_13495 [Burkholderia oklahomensis C6786]KUY57835.1 hypothetical protein WG70_08465 [Burkholderia oklahomensis EO147]